VDYEKDNLLKNLINNYVKEQKLTPKLLENKVVTNWVEIAGELIAKHTEKLYIVEGTLHLYVTSSALKHELSYQREKITQLVNQYLHTELIQQVVIR